MRSAFVLLCGAEEPAPALLEMLGSLGEEALVVYEGGSLSLLASCRLALVRPLLPGRGGIAHLHAALLVARADAVVAIDAASPLPRPGLLRALATHPARGNLLLPEAEVIRPFPGRYRRGCLRALRAALLTGERELLEVVVALRPARAGVGELGGAGAS